MNAVTNFDLRSYITWLKPSAPPAAFSREALVAQAAPAEQLQLHHHHPAETAQMLPQGNPFLLDHIAAVARRPPCPRCLPAA